MVSEKSPLGERDGFKNKSQHPGSLVRRLPASQAPLLSLHGFVCLLSNTYRNLHASNGSQSGREISLKFFSWGLTGLASYIFGLCKKGDATSIPTATGRDAAESRAVLLNPDT